MESHYLTLVSIVQSLYNTSASATQMWMHLFSVLDTTIHKRIFVIQHGRLTYKMETARGL